MQNRKIDFASARELYNNERKKGAVIVSPRKFGVEFEMVPYESGIRVNDVEKIINSLSEKTPSETERSWGIARDGSLSSDYGVEVQTPPMMLNKGEKEIEKFCSSMTGLGWKTDDSCGLHVHIDANDIKENHEIVRRLFLLYFVLDYCLLAMVPESRRTNVYCAPLDATKAKNLIRNRHTRYEKGFKLDSIIKSGKTKKDFLEMYYKKDYAQIPSELREHYNEARYHGINFHPLYSSYGTIEIRYLEGTLDSNLINNWIAFHQFIIDSARLIREPEAIDLFNTKGPKTRLRKFASITNMPSTLLNFACGRIDKLKDKK